MPNYACLYYVIIFNKENLHKFQLRNKVIGTFITVVLLRIEPVLQYTVQNSTVHTKEYILVRERTAPPCVFQTFAHPTSPCSVCRILQLPDCLTEQAGGEVWWANVYKYH